MNSRPPLATAALAPQVLASAHTQRGREGGREGGQDIPRRKSHVFSPRSCPRRAALWDTRATGFSALGTAHPLTRLTPLPQWSVSEGGC